MNLRRQHNRNGEIEVVGLLKKFPNYPRTKAEWEYDMKPKITFDGWQTWATVKGIITDREYGVIITREDNLTMGVPAGSLFDMSFGWDHRLLYTQNREVIGIKPEYDNEVARSWGPLFPTL
jgi:hypothetical protein